jgi:O-antigen/teichoic acid export membrane protein
LTKLIQQHKDLLATLANHFWRLISGPITLLLMPLFISPEQQGYWYLFGSIAAFSTLADLGFSNIILQFSAHEYAFMCFTGDGLLSGEEIYLRKSGSLLRFVIKWLFTVCIIAFPIIYIIGLAFFTRDDVLAIYIFPWTLYTIGSLINFFNNSILSFIEGMNKIEAIQKIRFFVSVFNTILVAIILVSNGTIYALACGMLTSAISMFLHIFLNFLKPLRQLISISKGFYYDWKKEILPYFIRYGISWICGFLIYNLYTPIAHYFYGPVYSGRVGISIALIMAILNLSSVWMYTVIPQINILISRKSWKELDMLFKKRSLLAIATYLAVSIAMFVLLELKLFRDFRIVSRIAERFLPMASMVILAFCYFFIIMHNNWSIYLRGHKREPMMVPAIISSLWTVVATYFIVKFLPFSWFFTGFLSSSIYLFLSCYIIYRQCKNKWHIQSA